MLKSIAAHLSNAKMLIYYSDNDLDLLRKRIFKIIIVLNVNQIL